MAEEEITELKNKYVLPFGVINYSFQKLRRVRSVKDNFLGNKVHFISIKFKEIDKELSCPQMYIFVSLFMIFFTRKVFAFIWMNIFLWIFIYLFILYKSNSHKKKSITTKPTRVRGEKFCFVNELFKNQHQIVQLWINLQILFY